MECSLLLQKKKREVSGHPITVGQTRGGHGGRLSPSCLAAPSLSRGWAEGFPLPHPCHPQIWALYTFVHDEAGALMPLPGKAGPGHLSTFACSPS